MIVDDKAVVIVEESTSDKFVAQIEQLVRKGYRVQGFTQSESETFLSDYTALLVHREFID